MLWRWLQPGLGVKRWLLMVVAGTALVGLGLAILLLDIYRAQPDSPWLSILSLRVLPRWLRAAVLGVSGTGLLLWAVLRLNRSLLAPYIRPGKSVVETIAEHRRRGRGPRIVAVGGGTGLSTLLRGLKAYSGNLTALVTVADDGGSSGRLRRSLGLPPPGDIRSCLASLSDDEDLLTQLFQYRFSSGAELDGHSFGNLFIAALAGVTGSFDRGVQEAGRVLGIRGRVVPTTLREVDLVAEKTPLADVQAISITGESRIPAVPGNVRRVQLQPSDPPAHPEAIRAILGADMLVIGPGSLYTSILPNLLVPDIVAAIRSSRAFKVYVCNVATQRGETDGYDCRAHLRAIEEHVGKPLVDLVVANNATHAQLSPGISWVLPPSDGGTTVPIYATDLIDPHRPWRHDSAKLADTLMALFEERTGPLEAPGAEPEEVSNAPA